jgi:hypothetical protein
MPGVPRELIEHSLNVYPKSTPKRQHLRRFADDRRDTKDCPKDPFGLPRIDQVTDSTAGCVLLCFLDCYSGYHQIAIKEEYQEKIAFITPFGAYCYTTMSFGLKNAGATYQQAIRPVSRGNSTRTSKLTWMMWSSRPETPTRSSPILKRL